MISNRMKYPFLLGKEIIIMNNEKLIYSHEDAQKKVVYVKPVIKQVRLVPGESVLGSCKLNNGIQAECNLGELCFGYTPFS